MAEAVVAMFIKRNSSAWGGWFFPPGFRQLSTYKVQPMTFWELCYLPFLNYDDLVFMLLPGPDRNMADGGLQLFGHFPWCSAVFDLCGLHKDISLDALASHSNVPSQCLDISLIRVASFPFHLWWTISLKFYSRVDLTVPRVGVIKVGAWYL